MLINILIILILIYKAYAQVDLGINYNSYSDCVELYQKKIWFDKISIYFNNEFRIIVNSINQQLYEVCYKDIWSCNTDKEINNNIEL